MPRLQVFAAVPARRAAEATPPDRDRVVDAARAVALLVVVAGHGVMAVVAWPEGIPRLGNLLAAFPWTQALTWLLQIMPLFFFAGGAANALSWDRAQVRGELVRGVAVGARGAAAAAHLGLPDRHVLDRRPRHRAGARPRSRARSWCSPRSCCGSWARTCW